MRLFRQGPTDRHVSQQQLSCYLDGALSANEMAGLDVHLASCDACRQEAEELRAVVGVLRAMPTVPAPRGFAIPVPAASAWSPRPARSWRAPAPLTGLRVALAGAAVALAVLFAGDLAGTFGSSPDVPIQVGKTEPAPLITAGTPPGPEKSLPLGEAPVADTGTFAAAELAEDALGVDSAQPSLVQGEGFALGLWPLELGLLVLTVALAGFHFFLRRRSSNS